MKLLITSLILPTFFAQASPRRTPIYSCVNYDVSKDVQGAVIYSSRYGNAKPFFEVKIQAITNGIKKSFTKRVNLLSKYEGRIQEYTTGGFRIKIDRVRQDEDGHFATFARIPQYDIHSREWSCKDY